MPQKQTYNDIKGDIQLAIIKLDIRYAELIHIIKDIQKTINKLKKMGELL